jgi:hypothetical protein
MRSLWIAPLLAALLVSGAASAEVCLFDEDNDALYRFAKLKLPKNLLDAAPLTGVSIVDGIPAPLPVTGAVTRLDDDTWIVGLTRHGDSCLVAGELGADFEGMLGYDCNLDGATDGDFAAIVPGECPEL